MKDLSEVNGERHHRAQGSNPRRPKFFQAFSHNCMMISIPWFTYVRFHMSVYSLVWLFSVNNYLFCIFSYQIIFLSHIQMNKLPELQMRVRNMNVKVAEHSFGSLWVYVIYQIMARERLQLTSWNLASEKYTDERFWLTGKIWRFRSFHGNMNDWIQP